MTNAELAKEFARIAALIPVNELLAALDEETRAIFEHAISTSEQERLRELMAQQHAMACQADAERSRLLCLFNNNFSSQDWVPVAECSELLYKGNDSDRGFLDWIIACDENFKDIRCTWVEREPDGRWWTRDGDESLVLYVLSPHLGPINDKYLPIKPQGQAFTKYPINGFKKIKTGIVGLMTDIGKLEEL